MPRSSGRRGASFLSFRGVLRVQIPLPVVILLFFTLLASQATFAQCKDCGSPSIGILSSHDDSGRGCVGCHAPHLDISRDRVSDRGNGTWEQSPNQVGEGGSTASPRNNVPVTRPEYGVLLCISCHDGNIVPENMAANQSYEQAGPFQTLLDERPSRGIGADHPLGPGATIEVGNGLQFSNGIFSVVPGSPYAQFVASYGWPCLAPGRASNHYGIDKQGRPYLVCTTCHDAHGRNIYVSRSGSPIANDGGGQYYTTFFFVNGPYNPNVRSMDTHTSTSTVQFCRQCHFHLSNEANNAPSISTKF